MPLDDCKIEHDDGVYRATLIVQHDKELIMPGDGAFALQCDSKSNAKWVFGPHSRGRISDLYKLRGTWFLDFEPK